jgi:hypothetical protein
MTGDGESGEMFPRCEVLGEKRTSLDEITAKWEDFEGGSYEPWERKKQDSFRKLFTKIYVVILSCSIALFGSVLLLRSPSPENQLSSAFIPRSAMAFSATTTMSSLTGSSSPSASPALITPVQVFQVFPPVLGSTGLIGSNGTVANTNMTDASASGSSCQVTLMGHSFATSFGKPFVGVFKDESSLKARR